MPIAKRGASPGVPHDAPQRSADAWDVLDPLGVDPAEHFGRMLLPDSDADDKRQDEAAKQLLPYCYARRGTLTVVDAAGNVIGYVRCDNPET